MATDVSLIHDDEFDTFRPALMRMALDAKETRDELLAGFDTRRDLVHWLRKLSLQTLGEIPHEFYVDFKPMLVGSGGTENHYHLDLLLSADSEDRTRDIEDRYTQEIRRRLWQQYCHPAYNRASRKRRKAAGEYLDDTVETDSAYDPARQRYIAMMPAIDQQDGYQRKALTACLDGLEDRDEVIEWLALLELATHHELDPGFAWRCYQEPSAVELLTGVDDVHARGREVWAVTYLLPQFNAGNRDLAGTAKEMPRIDHPEREAPEYL